MVGRTRQLYASSLVLRDVVNEAKHAISFGCYPAYLFVPREVLCYVYTQVSCAVDCTQVGTFDVVCIQDRFFLPRYVLLATVCHV